MRVMPPPPQHSRIDLAELKSQISKRIGMDRSRNYFGHLHRFLSRKLSKQEFDKLCLLTLGRENVVLHNRLVGAILRNACQAKVPPPQLSAGRKDVGKRPSSLANAVCHTSPSTSVANGDAVPPSPRRVRSGSRRMKDRPSPLGPNGRMDGPLFHVQGDQFMARENGELAHCDLKRPVQANQGMVAENFMVATWQQRVLSGDVASLQLKGPTDSVALREGMEVEPAEDPNSLRASIEAPLGIPFCPASVGGSRRPQSFVPGVSNAGLSSCSASGQLCHTHILKERMDQIAESQGLGGVTLDCANLLNAGLDSYLKRLIKSCIELNGARSVNAPIRQQVHKQQPQGKIINGMWPGNHASLQGGSGLSEEPNHSGRGRKISLLDFRVAMELNVQQLGEDWPYLLEKISLRSYEE